MCECSNEDLKGKEVYYTYRKNKDGIETTYMHCPVCKEIIDYIPQY